MGIYPGVGLPRKRRTRHITNPQDASPRLPHLADSCQSVGRLPALRNGNYQVVPVQNGIPVAELRSVFHLNRNARILLQKILSHQSRMPGSATSHNNDALGLNELGHYIQNASQKHLALVHGNPAPEGIANGHGLLMNFLQHKMRVIALVDVIDRKIDLLNVRRSEEHTSELQSRPHLVCRLLLEKK